MLSLWFDASRWVYNETVSVLNSTGESQCPALCPPGQSPHPNSIYKAIFAKMPLRLVEAPFQVKKIAVKDACQALKQGKKRVKTGMIPRFDLHFRSRKDTKQSIYIPSSAVKSSGIYVTLLGKMRAAEDFPLTPRDSRLILEHGRYYLSTPMPVDVAETQGGGICALDPGVRTFMSLFGLLESDEIHGHYGRGAITRIMRLCLAADDIIGRLKTLPTRVRKSSLKRALSRIKSKIQDLLAELHHQMAAWLCGNFSVIFLPTFETSQMVRRGERILRSKTVRSMLTLGHYRFKQHLKSVAERTGVQVYDVSEAYTSKTNSWTGVINPKLGGAKFITVDGLKVDRDLNGARGIFLKALGDKPTIQPGSALTISASKSGPK